MTALTHLLEAIQDIEAAQSLKAWLMSQLANDQDVILEAHAVERMSTHGLQLLLSACLSFKQAHLNFEILNPSAMLLSVLSEAGLPSTVFADLKER